MFDFHFDWNSSMEIGVAEIDEHHKQLLRIGRDIEQLLQIKCIGVTEQQLLDIVCELRDYVAYHYYEEEALMEREGYPKLKEHRAEHQKYVDLVQHLDWPAMKRNPEPELKKLRDLLADLLFSHILTWDKEMGTAILAKQKEIAGIRKEEREKTMTEIALRMLARGKYEPEEIADISGLAIEKITELEQEEND